MSTDTMTLAGSAPKLDERALRRPDFRGGHPVVMADEQAWWIPAVFSTFVLDDSAEEGIRRDWNFGAEYEALLKGLMGKVGYDAIRPEMAIYRFLLSKNYELSHEQLTQVLRIDFSGSGDGRNREMLDALREIMGGGHPAGPKSESPETSPSNGR